MDPALTAALLAAVTGAVSAFIAYWAGVGESVDDDTLIATLYFDLLPEIVRLDGT